MDNNRDKRAEAYDRIIEYQKQLHERNQKRINLGIKLVLVIPLIFLIIMFKLDSSKVVFLVLWIASMFIISAYLITVEYADYKIQKQLKEWGLYDNVEFKGLINKETMMEKVIMNSIFMDDSKENEEESDEEIEEIEEDLNVTEKVHESEKKPDASEKRETFVKKSPDDYAKMRRAKAIASQSNRKNVADQLED